MTNSRFKSGTITKVKKVDESIDTSTTLQDDDELSITLKTSTVYYFEMTLLFDGHSDGDLKYKFSGPTGCTADFHTVPVTGGIAMVTNAISTTVTQACTASGTTTMIVHSGRIIMSTTAGNFTLTWAQNASHATATKILKGSILKVVEAL